MTVDPGEAGEVRARAPRPAFAARVRLGVRLLVGPVPVRGTSAEPVDAVSRRIAEGLDGVGATVAERPGPAGGSVRATLRLTRMGNDPDVELAGAVRTGATGATVFEGSLTPDFAGRMGGLIVAFFCISGALFLVSAPLRLELQTSFDFWFFTLWGLAGVTMPVVQALMYAKGAEPFVWVLGSALGDHVSIGRRAPVRAP
jgi:hypothetical protein